MKNNLFDETLIIENCILKNEIKFHIKIMIDNDVIDYEFINHAAAHEICERLNISLVELMKPRYVKKYDDKKDSAIIHVIYLRMQIQNHIENFTFLMIIKLVNVSMILEKP